MAIEYSMRAVCDKCGSIIEPPVSVTKGHFDSVRWSWLAKWKTSGVMVGLQPKLRQAKLYCHKCADS
jgi:hypothetical protein